MSDLPRPRPVPEHAYRESPGDERRRLARSEGPLWRRVLWTVTALALGTLAALYAPWTIPWVLGLAAAAVVALVVRHTVVSRRAQTDR